MRVVADGQDTSEVATESTRHCSSSGRAFGATRPASTWPTTASPAPCASWPRVVLDSPAHLDAHP